MKTSMYILIFTLVGLQLSSHAQKEPVALSAQAGIYGGYGNGGMIGPGFGITAAKKITPTSALSLSLGYISLCSTKKPFNGFETKTKMIPVMLGYRKYWNKFFLEPRAGLGELGGKFNIGEDLARPSVLAFMYALGTGYSFRKIDLSLDLQGGAIGISSPDAGYWYNQRQYYAAVKIGVPLFKIK
jgi:hypothetical protein